MTARVVATEPPRPTIYTEAMEVFHRAADLIGLDRRVRMELEEPDYEDAPWRRGRAGTSIGRAVHAVLQTVDLATGAGLAAIAGAQARNSRNAAASLTCIARWRWRGRGPARTGSA